MKVVIVGGAGSVGQAVARDLIKYDIFERIVVADILISEERIHESLKSAKKVSFETMDLYDEEKMVNVLNGANVVVNCAGPFYKTAIPVVKAAIKVRANYIDICDDYEATDMLLSSPEIDESAKSSNITILTGMGSDPGTNNLLVKRYAQRLDEVTDVLLYWVVSIAEISGAALDHSLHMVLGKVPQFIDGRLCKVEGGDAPEMVEFLPPLGTCLVRYVGHPQPLTIPRYLPGVKNVVIKGGLVPSWVDEFILKQKEMGLLERKTVKIGEVFIDTYEFTLHLWDKILESREKGPKASGLKVVVRGKRGKSIVQYTASIAGRMAPGTGLPAAIAAIMMAKGKIKEKGVQAPEGCIEPNEFLSEFIRRGAKIHESCEEKKVLDIEDL
ncbi:MAG: saccharopine dehydrogenase NADP-binding domain-containing protein [Desulfobacterota bacterium]|nr:saccharopine dehydrogenase NADP-binding domain-containing protein [Thermodesulfobacteriota bacterium]MDW8002166.1 saccharopine dehydrogenase NADP-binding domain-containing protein [Deltaproteobacteria bacterium]